MGIISGMEQRSRLENPQVPLSAHNAAEVLGLSQPSAAGISVTHERALGITAFWCGVRAISQTIAGLDLKVYEKVDEKKRRQAPEHSLYRILHKRPNPMMSAFTFKELRAAHILTWGNNYAEIERDRAGRPIALWPLLPDRTGVEIKKINGKHQKVYHTEINGTRIWLSSDRVLHVPGLGFDGMKGYNVIKIHRDSLGLTVAANEHGSQFYKNSARPSGVLRHPGKPEKAERVEIRDEWNQLHSGLTNSQRTAVLWGGMEWQPTSIPPEEAQFLQTRELQIDEMARILNINPILLQHFTKATTWGTGIAQFLVAFGKLTIAPWLERDEDVLDWDLFSESEREKYYTKYNLDSWLRGDPETQAKILEIERRNGVINGDEWRELKDDNPLPGGLGQAYYIPLNWAPVEQVQDREPNSLPSPQRAQTREKRSLAMRRRLRDAHLQSFEDGARRFVKRDVDSLKKTIKKAFEGGGDPRAVINRWVSEFYPEQQRYIKRIMTPLVSALAAVVAADAAEEVGAEPENIDVFVDGYTDSLASREAGSSRGQILSLVDTAKDEELEEILVTRAEEWSEKRAGKIAMNEVVQVASGASRFAWTAAGVSYLVWRANAGACPLCEQMDGRKTGIKDYFLKTGDSVGDQDRPGGITLEHNVGGPPLHQGCQCDIVPE